MLNDTTAGVDPLVSPDASSRVALDDLLTGLDDDRREAFVLTQVLGLQYDEAAEVLGVPIGTIRSRVSRARGDLLDALDQREDHGADASADVASGGR